MLELSESSNVLAELGKGVVVKDKLIKMRKGAENTQGIKGLLIGLL